jgi:hypothetical protein
MLLFRTNGMKQSTLLLLLFLCLVLPVDGQNLVPNGSFEEYIDCPLGLDDMQALGWSSSRGSCDYYNACNNDVLDCGVGVPCNANGYQNAYNGQGYVGFVQFSTPTPDYREQLTCALIEPLVIGETYYFSVRINRGTSNFLNKASNGQGFLLTTTFHDAASNPSPAFLMPSFVNNEVLTDSTNWLVLNTSFVADSAYTHLVLGAFLESSQLDTLDMGVNDPTGEAYYFLDDVRLSADSNFVHTGVVESSARLESKLGVYPNPAQSKLFFSRPLQDAFLRVFNHQGELIKEIKIKSKLSYLEVSDLPPGRYFIVVNGLRYIDKLLFIKN